MAKEYPGVLLCMAAVLRSTKGRAKLSSKNGYFSNDQLRDWSLVVETKLQWERWLKSETMEKHHVQKAKEKHRYILYLLKSVADRQKGMGFKVQKYHGVTHPAGDMLKLGKPMETDTGFNESHHKKTKQAALLTQRNQKTFDKQVAIRLEEVEMIKRAIGEMEGQYGTYFGQITRDPGPLPPKNNEIMLGGSDLAVIEDPECQKWVLRAVTKRGGRKGGKSRKKSL